MGRLVRRSRRCVGGERRRAVLDTGGSPVVCQRRPGERGDQGAHRPRLRPRRSDPGCGRDERGVAVHLRRHCAHVHLPPGAPHPRRRGDRPRRTGPSCAGRAVRHTGRCDHLGVPAVACDLGRQLRRDGGIRAVGRRVVRLRSGHACDRLGVHRHRRRHRAGRCERQGLAVDGGFRARILLPRPSGRRHGQRLDDLAVADRGRPGDPAVRRRTLVGAPAAGRARDGAGRRRMDADGQDATSEPG